MKILFSFLLLLPIGLRADESVEPTLHYTLKIGERSYQVSEGKPFEVEGGAGKTAAVLKAAEHRVFPYQDLVFDYPAYFTFEADFSDPKDKSWTLSGNNCKIMILTMKSELTTAQFAENLVRTFGEKNSKVSEAKVELGKVAYKGTGVEAKVASSRMAMEIFSMKAPKGWSKLLVIQDAISDAGNHSAEHGKVMEMLKASFKETQPGDQEAKD